MSYKIGLKRVISQNKLIYYLTVSDSSKISGKKIIEKLGFYTLISDN